MLYDNQHALTSFALQLHIMLMMLGMLRCTYKAYCVSLVRFGVALCALAVLRFLHESTHEHTHTLYQYAYAVGADYDER